VAFDLLLAVQTAKSVPVDASLSLPCAHRGPPDVPVSQATIFLAPTLSPRASHSVVLCLRRQLRIPEVKPSPGRSWGSTQEQRPTLVFPTDSTPTVSPSLNLARLLSILFPYITTTLLCTSSLLSLVNGTSSTSSDRAHT